MFDNLILILKKIATYILVGNDQRIPVKQEVPIEDKPSIPPRPRGRDVNGNWRD